MKKKFAIVEIKGGLGNQLFQFAFANSLKEKGFNVRIGLKKFYQKDKKITTRELVVQHENFSIKKSNTFQLKVFYTLYKLTQSKKIQKFLKYPINLIFSKFINFDEFNKLDTKLLNLFDGYWQDIQLIESQKNYILHSLSKTKDLNKTIQKSRQPGSTLVHVRRGDYVEIDETLEEKFYLDALNYCKKNIENFYYEVFTDDIDWVASNKIFSDALKIHPPSENAEQVLETYSNMLNFDNFIVGNSTFSLTAAILSENSNAIIIVADPWFRNLNTDLKFDKKFIKIKNLKPKFHQN